MNPFQAKRRSFLCALASVPGLGLLVPARQAAAQESARTRDVIQELGVRSFINAAGTFTAMTGSLMRPGVMAAMEVASHKYVLLEDLHDAVGKRIRGGQANREAA
jgi:D-glucosaminate-6-phosphate ammonia-lyase